MKLSRALFALGVAGLLAACQSPLLSVQQTSPVARGLNQLQTSFEAETMTLGGSYAGIVSSPFAGVGLYGGSDTATKSVTLSPVPGLYRVDVQGASNNAKTAAVRVALGGTTLGNVTFTGTASATSSLAFSVSQSGALNLVLSCPTDNGSWDVFVDNVKIYYEGPVPAPLPPPTVPTDSVWNTKAYRNLFVEWGKTPAEVTAKVDGLYNQLFVSGTENQKIYYEVGSDKAYIYTPDTNDVRSEGMSYGMMITVQKNDKARFDKLWNWANTYMLHKTGDRAGYFAWQMKTDGSVIDQNPAPDGEEYFAMALYFAWKQWGNGTGIYNYQQMANNILDQLVAHRTIAALPTWSGIANLIDPTQKQVVFSTEGNSATFTDPSYHLPAFYELWARWATSTYYDPATYWPQVAQNSRAFWKKALNTNTFLGPDYATFEGAPSGGNHAQFRFDAWRTIMNLSLDYSWFRSDPWEKTAAEGLQTFFANQGVTTYGNQFNLDGTVLSEGAGNHSTGLVGMNAVTGLVSSSAKTWDFVADLWNAAPEEGNYRYWNGTLQLFAMLHLSGNFKIIDNGSVPPTTPTPPTNPPASVPAAPSALTATAASSTQINLSWTDNASNETGFKLEKSADGTTWTALATTAAGVTAYQHTGLTASTKVYYRVRATNAAGDSANTAANATTLAAPVTGGTWAQKEAESFTGSSGVSIVAGDGGQAVRFAGGTSSWISFSVNFDKEPQSIDIRCAAAAYGVNVTFRVDSINGTTFCTLYPNGGNTWHLKSNSTWPRPTGTHTVYITSTGGIDINWFQFK